jgi:hypothetical protein
MLTAFLNSSNSPKTMSLPFASNLQQQQKKARRAARGQCQGYECITLQQAQHCRCSYTAAAAVAF